MNKIQLRTPLSDDDLTPLKMGDHVLISGVIYTGRDAAHIRFAEAVAKGESLPFDPRGQVIYYVGPTPAKPGSVIGSAGPTTANRMDPDTPLLIERGLKGMIGKGGRSDEVRAAMQKHKCVYFGAIEGTAALLSKKIKSSEIIAYEDLGAEAVYKLEVEDFPVLVINDLYGGDLYIHNRKKYQKN